MKLQLPKPGFPVKIKEKVLFKGAVTKEQVYIDPNYV